MKLFCSWCRISLSGIDHVSVNPGSILNHQPFSFEPNVSPIQSLTGPVLATNSMAMENHLSRGKAGSQTEVLVGGSFKNAVQEADRRFWEVLCAFKGGHFDSVTVALGALNTEHFAAL